MRTDHLRSDTITFTLQPLTPLDILIATGFLAKSILFIEYIIIINTFLSRIILCLDLTRGVFEVLTHFDFNASVTRILRTGKSKLLTQPLKPDFEKFMKPCQLLIWIIYSIIDVVCDESHRYIAKYPQGV